MVETTDFKKLQWYNAWNWLMRKFNDFVVVESERKRETDNVSNKHK